MRISSCALVCNYVPPNLHSFNNRTLIKEECAILRRGRLTLTGCWVINEVRRILQASVGRTIRYLLLCGTCNDYNNEF
jgi:hypothetical protein